MATELSNTPLYTEVGDYWKLEDVNATVGGVNLTNVGTVTFGTAQFNNGADLGSTNTTKYLTVANDLGIAGGACSFSFWIKINTQPATDAVTRLFIQDDAGNDVAFLLDYRDNSGTKKLRFNRQRQGTADDEFLYEVTLSSVAFTHIVMTYNGTTLRGYVNGADIGNVASSGNGASGGSDLFRIGANENGTTQFSSAIYDDFAVFDRALTATEVSNLYTGDFGVGGIIII